MRGTPLNSETVQALVRHYSPALTPEEAHLVSRHLADVHDHLRVVVGIVRRALDERGGR